MLNAYIWAAKHDISFLSAVRNGVKSSMYGPSTQFYEPNFESTKIMILVPLEREFNADLITTSIEIFTSSSLSIIISLSLLLYVIIIIIIIIYYHSSTTNKTIIMLRYNNIRPTQCDLSVPPIQCALIMWKYNAGLARLISLFLPLVVVVVEECYIIIIIILLLPQPKEGLMLIMLRVGSTATNEAEPNE